MKGIAANYARLKTVEATVEWVALDPGVTERVTTTRVGPMGTVATLTREPKSTHTCRLLLRGEEVRSENGVTGSTFAFSKGVWTQYEPAIKQAWLRGPDQAPDFVAPLDLREVGSVWRSDQFLGRLGKGKLLGAESRNDRTVIEVEGPVGRGVRYEFDPARNHLPTRVSELHADGSINVVTDITYQDAVRGEAWFPKEVTIRIYGRPGAKAGDPGWTGQVGQTVKDLKVNRLLAADAFEVPLPEGTSISDAVGGGGRGR
ncbi:MAG TPA: hypothetical protein VH092_30895 [Urbifossiella sp.]|nr:hypothetical protein [Urbifossiella sp.]